MTFSKGINASAATKTKNRTPNSVSPFSGLCTTCLGGCPGFCEVGMSAYRGREILYPQPFGTTTFAAEKDFPVDYSHFTISGSAVGAHGIEADSDKAVFNNVRFDSSVGKDKKIKFKVPVVVPGLGSTRVAKDNWLDLAAGSAISGVGLTIGENVVGMDPEAVIENGEIKKAPDLEFRIKSFTDYYDGNGAIILQNNVEDTKLGVMEFAIDKLGIEVAEMKWGQGAKSIGGEVKIPDLDRALMLKRRGYIVHPNPEEPEVQQMFKNGVFKEFERHSRIGMVTEESFLERAEYLRKLGAKHVFLKTGAYGPADLARAVVFASKGKIDLLTVDGTGGGTGMSPWRMMNEWGMPTVYLQSLLYQYLEKLKAKGAHVPDVAIAGGFALEDQMFKAFALAAPYVKLIGMARGPLTAVMVGKTLGQMIKDGKVPKNIAEKYGTTQEQIFNSAYTLKQKFGGKYNDLPAGAIGLYSYFDRLTTGLQQLMCGARKFSLEYITRDDIMCLTRESADISGLPYVMDHAKEEVEGIFNSL